MQIEYLGHAGFVVRGGGTSVLVDPFFHPAFLESWFPLPPNRFLLDEVLDQRFDFLYISHTHEDHFDRRALASVAKDTVVICPDFRSRSVRRDLGHLGFRELVQLGHGSSAELGAGMTATMLVDTSHKEDSGLLIEHGGTRFLDLNDCHVALSEMPRDVDMLAAQFSGAMWYPNCYDYGAPVMQEKVEEVRRNILDTLVRTVFACDARWYLPSAGPACFLDPSLRRFNDPAATIFAQWEDVAPQFGASCPDVAVVRMAPGDAVELDRVSGVALTTRPAPPSETIEAYAARLGGEWGAHVTRSFEPVTTDELGSYFRSLQRKNRHLLEDEPARQLRLESDGSVWGVLLGAYPALEVTYGAPPSADYAIVVPGWVLRRIIDGETGWEEALLSMRLSLRRQPDVFDVKLLGFLRYGRQPIQTQQLVRDSTSRAEMVDRGDVRLPRYCPHAGEDLSEVPIVDDVIECPRHHWRWDVRTGQCLSGGNLRLLVEAVDASVDVRRSDGPVPGPAGQ